MQSEDKSVAIWRCDDWSVVAAVRAPYAKLVTSTFSTRMSWSPDGSFLATGGFVMCVRWWEMAWGSGKSSACVFLYAVHDGLWPAPNVCLPAPLPLLALALARPTGNSYQGSSHAAVVLQRERWNEDKEHLLVSGHQGEAWAALVVDGGW